MKSVSALVCFAACSALAQAPRDYPFCQILDRIETPAWEIQTSYLMDGEVKDTGKSFGLFGVRGGGGLGYFRTESMDVDLTGAYDIKFPTSSAGLDLPSQLAALSLNASFMFRNSDGLGLRLAVAPGIYSDLEAASLKSLYCPFSVSAIQAFNDQLSGIVGLALFPGFDQFVDPIFGIRWAPNESLMIDLQYPTTRVVFTPDQELEFYAGVTSSQTPEWYTDKAYGNLMMDELQGFIGMSHPVGEDLRLHYRAGLSLNRKIESEVGAKVDVADAYFIGIGIGTAL